MKFTGERIIPRNYKKLEDYLLYLRHIVPYEYVLERINSNTKILEIGFGEGYGAHLLSKRAKQVCGIDKDIVAVNHANKKYNSRKCIFKHSDGNFIPYSDNSFDVIISFQVIEHVRDVKMYLKEINRVLKKNGTFYCTTPNRNYRLLPNQKPWNKFHLREYYPSEFYEEIKKIFSSVKLFGVSGKKEVQETELYRANLIKIPLAIKDQLFLKNSSLMKDLSQTLYLWFKYRFIVKLPKRNWKNIYSTSDFYIHNERVVSSLDLFIIAHK